MDEEILETNENEEEENPASLIKKLRTRLKEAEEKAQEYLVGWQKERAEGVNLRKRMEEEKTSAGGIVIPDSATEKPVRGQVVAAGSGKILNNGQVMPLAVKVGDEVLFGKYAGTEVKLNGQELLLMREDDIMGVIVA